MEIFLINVLYSKNYILKLYFKNLYSKNRFFFFIMYFFRDY